MKPVAYLIAAILVTYLVTACDQRQKASSSDSRAPNPIYSNDWKSPTNTDPWAVAMRKADAIYQEKFRNPQTNAEVPLPNYDPGPFKLRPIHTNFYETADYYPDYLLCSYDVDEKKYNQSDEPKWFNAALQQVRQLGSEKFPPFNRVAVVIVNRAEHKDVSTFEQSHKVGAIFAARDLFDSSRDLSQMIADAKKDRHPFKYDPSQATPREQQRWIIVEQK